MDLFRLQSALVDLPSFPPPRAFALTPSKPIVEAFLEAVGLCSKGGWWVAAKGFTHDFSRGGCVYAAGEEEVVEGGCGSGVV